MAQTTGIASALQGESQPTGHQLLSALSVTLAAGFGLHFALQLIGPAMFFNPNWAVYWPLNGILVATLLMVPRRYWPPILLGAVLNQVQREYSDETVAEMLCDAAAFFLQVLLPAFLLPPFRNLSDWMQQPRLISRFIGFALLLASVLSGLPDALAHVVFHHDAFWPSFLRWTFADTLGMALWLPLVLTLRDSETYCLFHWRALPRTLFLLGLTCGASWFVFHQSVCPVAFVIMPTLLLVAFQLGFSGAVFAVNLLTVIVCQATLHGLGPFQLIASAHSQYRVVVLQLFLTLCMLMSLPVTVLLLQRRNFERKLREAYLQMEAAATEDGLTGIANRRRFDSALQAEWLRGRREHQPLGLLMIDVDHFKLYNDAYGHLAGDDCLRRVAAALASVPLRPSDLLARYGGEEFAFLLPRADQSGILRLAERIREEVALLGLPHGRAPGGTVTVSIGADTLHPKPGAEPSTLIQAADQALYAAKLSGRNRVHVSVRSETLVLS